MRVNFDLETIPQQPEASALAEIAKTIKPPAQMSKPETIKEWMEGTGKYEGVREAEIFEAYHRTGLNGAKGHICSLTYSIEDSEELRTFYALPVGSEWCVEGEGPAFKADFSEADLLRSVFAELTPELKGRPPFFCGHFIGGFDLPFLFQRCVVNGVNPLIPLYQYGRHGSDYFDTMVAWSGWKGHISMDDLCMALGLPGAAEGEIGGADVWTAYKAGEHGKIIAHNQNDVRRLNRIYKRLTFSA